MPDDGNQRQDEQGEKEADAVHEVPPAGRMVMWWWLRCESTFYQVGTMLLVCVTRALAGVEEFFVLMSGMAGVVRSE
jgi:hypothetical protein